MRERVHWSHCSGQTSSHLGRLFTQTQGMLHRAKYSRFRNDSLTSLDEGTANASLRVKNASSALCPPSSTSTATSTTNNSPSRGCPGEELSSESEDLSSTISTPTSTTTTFCTFIPKMASLKLSNPVSLLGLKSFSLGAARELPKMRLTNTFSSQSISAPSAVDLTSACLSASSPPKQETGKGAPSTRMLKPEVEEHHPGGEDWNLSHNVEPLGKALKGWSLPRDHIQGSGITYTVRYMGCVEVMQSMRSLDFNMRTQVTREAISRVCEAVPGAKGAMRKRKPPSKGLSTVLGKSNLQFAGMNITLNISTSSLNLMIPDSKQIIANHHMQSISFASGGDPDTTDYVAYVAKDPVNQRACHILECSDSIAQDVINTIGQAFELRFKQYMKNPSAFNAHNDSRIQGFSGLVWNEQNEELEDLEYNNEFPGKQPPSGGSPATRIKEDSAVYKNSSQLQRDEGFKQAACESIYENCSDQHKQTLIMAGSSWNRFPQSNANTLPIKATSRSDLFDDPCYMNTQNVERADFTGKNAAVVQGPGNTYREHSEAAPNNATIDCHTTAPPPASPSSMKEQLVKEVWYHGRMTRQEAERLLLNDGDFLVRESMTTTGQYVLTGLQGGQAKHLLLVDPEGMVRTKDHIFDSVNHLISYHVDNHLPIISPGHELFLKKTVRSKQQQ